MNDGIPFDETKESGAPMPPVKPPRKPNVEMSTREYFLLEITKSLIMGTKTVSASEIVRYAKSMTDKLLEK